MATKSKPSHHMHALSKGSATHLRNEGLISAADHKRIVKHAEKGMASARGGETADKVTSFDPKMK